MVSAAVAHRIPAGWYRDRDDPMRRRWWNGIEWTEYYSALTQPILTVVEDPDIQRPESVVPVQSAAAPRRAPARGTLSRRLPFVLLAILSIANLVVLLSLFVRL